MPATLHITNGDSVQLRDTGLPGEVLTWKDVLHEGPVPCGLSLDQLRPIRAHFLAEGSGQLESTILGELEKRDRTLAGFAEFEEVVLWFEHDLYDQLQLIQILDWFSRKDLGKTKLSLICTDRYLGMLTPDELLELYPKRVPVSPGKLELAARAWEAFSAADPNSIVELFQEDTSDLPYLQGALLRHLEQFPSTRNGLSRTERQILEIADAGLSRVGSVFCADRDREERIFMGDLVFNTYMHRLANARVPLVEIDRDEKLFWNAEVAITAEGRALLRAEFDNVRVNGIDRWLGGVHLHGSRVWRWDRERGKLEFAPPLG
ncbi:MAG TPA: hypothetical protein VMT20_10880 [Terriglobia bacterium]|nr:hypothetical protein [Terriglobia bacterium]